MIHLVRVLLFVLLTTIVNAQEKANNSITVAIENISNGDGQLLIGLYNNKGEWLKKTYLGDIGTIANGKCTVVFKNIPNDIYAISVFHDEDKDNELDTLFGIPTEDTGSSNNAPANFGPPKWEDAKFEVRGETVNQNISL